MSNETTKEQILEQIKAIEAKIASLAAKTPVKHTYTKGNKQHTGEKCTAIIKYNEYTGHIERCNRLLTAGCLCAGEHKEYIKYDADGKEEFREVLQ